MRGLYYLIFFLGFISCNGLIAQHFPSKQYLTSDGMPSNSIYDIGQQEGGMMWFMSKAGPIYYDSRTWYTFPDSLNLPTSANSRIRAYGDRIWVAGLNDTALTVQYYIDSEWIDIGVPELESALLGLMLFDVRDSGDEYVVLLGFKNSLYTYSSHGEVWERIPIPKGLLLNNIQMIDGKFLLSTTEGLYQYSHEASFEKVPLPYEQLPSEFFLNLEYRDGIYYILAYNWFAEMTESEIIYLIPDVILNNSAKSSKTSVVVNDQNIIFGANTPARLVNRAEHIFQDLLIDGKKLNIGGTRIFADQEGTIWLSDTRGLFKFNLLQFENYNSNSGLIDDEVSVVLELRDGSMVLANPEQLNLLSEGSIVNYPSQRKSDQNFRILDALVDESTHELLLASHDGGLIFYDLDDFETPKKVIAENERITTIEKFRDKTYVAGTKGLFEVRNHQMIPIEGDLSSIRNLSVLGSRLGLYTTGYGMKLFDGTNYQHYSSPVFSLRSVYDGVIYEGEIVLATGDGLATLSENVIVPWTELEMNSPVYSLLADDSGKLWIGSDHGVYRYNGVDLDLFNINEGLLGNEINRNSLFEDSKGRIWIGTEKGVSLFKGRSETNKQINLNITISEVKMNGVESIIGQLNPELNYKDNNLQITFRCLSYIDEQKINYRYRIKKTDDQWIPLSNDVSVVNLTNLEHGDYQFEIQARFGNGDWGPSSVFAYKIDQPFYYTWWFLVLIAAILIVIARTVFYFRYLFLIKKQRVLEALIAARTQEIQELNDQLEEKVKIRTMELEDTNLKLSEYAFINAHHLRAPLAKIMSAVHVVEETEGRALNKEMLRVLSDSAKELDQVIYSINDILKED